MSGFAVRHHLGGLVRSAAALLFPSIVVIEDREPEFAILLYLFETVLWSALLCVRSAATIGVLRRAAGDAGTARHISQARLARELTWVTVLIGVVLLPMLGMAMFAVRGGAWQPQWDILADRARWLAVTVLASAFLDTVLVATARSPLWLQSAVAQQMTRLFVLHPVVMFGFILYHVTGSTTGMVAIFVVLRLFVDVSGWRPASRRVRRQRWFGALADEEPKVPRPRRPV